MCHLPYRETCHFPNTFFISNKNFLLGKDTYKLRVKSRLIVTIKLVFNELSVFLMQPDIAAPGIDILASYTLRKSLTGLKGDTQFSEFTVMSGTSMACPHVAGVAAYVKSFHPNWTPAAVRSAIITTGERSKLNHLHFCILIICYIICMADLFFNLFCQAKPMSRRINNEAEFAFGSGQVNPTRAVSPGLVYDMDGLGYIQFLCHEGYSDSTLSALVGSPVNCSSLIPGIGIDAINYPTMQLSLDRRKGSKVGVFRRTVTNVGPVPTMYNATIRSPKGVEIRVVPTSLTFSKTMQKKSFKVVVKVKSIARMQILSGSLIWRSPRYLVRSPVVIYRP